MSRGHSHDTCTRKNFKTQGTQHRLEYYPSSPPQRKHPPRITHWEGTNINKVALKFTGSWGSWGSEVPKSSPTLHLPGELNPLLDRLTPLVACSKVGTFGKRPMDE